MVQKFPFDKNIPPSVPFSQSIYARQHSEPTVSQAKLGSYEDLVRKERYLLRPHPCMSYEMRKTMIDALYEEQRDAYCKATKDMRESFKRERLDYLRRINSCDSAGPHEP